MLMSPRDPRARRSDPGPLWLLRLDLGPRLAKIGQNVSTFLPHDHSETAGVLDLGLAPAPRNVFRLAGPGGPTV